MKATGIIRRIDDLGRINIPKEIRRTLRIQENTPIEVFTEGDKIILCKYEEQQGIQNDLENIVKELERYKGIDEVLTHLKAVIDKLNQ